MNLAVKKESRGLSAVLKAFGFVGELRILFIIAPIFRWDYRAQIGRLVCIRVNGKNIYALCVFRSIRTAIPASFGQAFRCRPDKLILTSHDFLFT